MSVAGAFSALTERGTALGANLSALRITLVEDRPQGREIPLMVEHLGDRAEELCGTLQEMWKCMHDAEQALSAENNLDKARQALIGCQNEFTRMLCDAARLLDIEAYRERQRLRRRSRQWQAWIATVEQALAPLHSALCALSQALGDCWIELSDYLAARGNTANATIHGQNISLHQPSPRRRSSLTGGES